VEWDAVYKPINDEFARLYPNMNDSSYLRWKYQRYMQD